MKKTLFLALLMLSSQMAEAKQVTVQTKNMTMVLNVDEGKQPQYVYFGAKLSDYDLAHLQAPRGGRMDAYPAYGMDCPAEAALAMRHADGSLATELVATGVEQQDGVTRIHLKDTVYPVFYQILIERTLTLKVKVSVCSEYCYCRRYITCFHGKFSFKSSLRSFDFSASSSSVALLDRRC